MSRENQVHYSRIGLVVMLGAAAIVATLIYLGGFRDPESEILVETYSDNPVTGLSVGSPVNLFGVKIGEVREISFAMSTYWDKGVDTNDFGRVCIVMALDRNALHTTHVDNAELWEFVRERAEKGLRATVTANGITGLARVELKVVDGEAPPPPPAWISRYPLVPPAPSLMDNFSVAATKLMNKLKKMDFDVVWSNVNRTADAAASAAESADATLESSRAGVRQIMSDVSEATLAIKTLAGTLKENPTLLWRKNDPVPLKETER